MLSTPLHRLLGEPPGDITDAMIDAAVEERLVEGQELDWKQKLPVQREFRQSDIVKDIAAMANTSGGVIVFGVKEDQRVASERTDAASWTRTTSERFSRLA